MGFKKHNWHKIANSLSDIKFGANNIALVELEGRPVCIGKFKDQLFAFAHECPHAGGLMSEGHIDAMGNITCPVHEIKFDIKNGENVSGEGFQLKTWPVEIRKNGVYAGIVGTASFWSIFR